MTTTTKVGVREDFQQRRHRVPKAAKEAAANSKEAVLAEQARRRETFLAACRDTDDEDLNYQPPYRYRKEQ